LSDNEERGNELVQSAGKYLTGRSDLTSLRLEFHQQLLEKLEPQTATLTLPATYLHKKTLRL